MSNMDGELQQLEKLFKEHLKAQYTKGYEKGVQVGLKLLAITISDMIEHDNANTETILEYCNKTLEHNAEKDE